mmetsp:Transcript_59230/g.98243  ORF Transcript_59230/g.98243 Transcript_59230/m.98243 type:complete len:113 (-) Transcript_59230:323-661(-)
MGDEGKIHHGPGYYSNRSNRTVLGPETLRTIKCPKRYNVKQGAAGGVERGARSGQGSGTLLPASPLSKHHVEVPALGILWVILTNGHVNPLKTNVSEAVQEDGKNTSSGSPT